MNAYESKRRQQIAALLTNRAVLFEDRVREVADFVEQELRAAYRRSTQVRPVAMTVRSTRPSAVQAGAIKRVLPDQA